MQLWVDNYIHGPQAARPPGLVESGHKSVTKLLFRVRSQCVTEILGNEKLLPMHNNRDAERVVVLMEDICAVPRRVHQSLMYGLHIRGFSYVLRHGVEAQAGCAHALLQ